MKTLKWFKRFRSEKKKEIKHPPIDLSDFKEDLEPWLNSTRALKRARAEIDQFYSTAHTAFWDKINEVLGYKLPGDWTFTWPDYTITYKGGNDSEEAETPEPSPFPSYEEHWEGMLATFYKDK